MLRPPCRRRQQIAFAYSPAAVIKTEGRVHRRLPEVAPCSWLGLQELERLVAMR